MELNKRVSKSKSKFTRNKEGGLVKKDNLKKKFLLQSASLQIKHSTFYFSEREILREYLETLSRLATQDLSFVLNTTAFVVDKLGRRLTPAVVLGYLAGCNNGSLVLDYDKKKLNRFIKQVTKRPDFIANACVVYKDISGFDSFGAMPDEFRKGFKEVLESFDDRTLKKFKMRRREIKLKDLIKVFKPKPKNEYYSRLYKSIIEDSALCKLKEDEHVTATLTSTKLSEDEKQKILKDSIETMPINALIRNLKQFRKAGFTGKDIDRIKDRLLGILEDEDAFKYFNIFDLFDVLWVLGESRGNSKVNMLKRAVAKVIVEYAKRNNVFRKYESAVLLLDASYSMASAHGRGEYFKWNKKSLYYTVMLYLMGFFAKADIKIVMFSSIVRVIKSPIINTKRTGAQIIEGLLEYFDEKASDLFGGTQLLKSIDYVVENFSFDKLFIVSDEVTWGDTANMRYSEYNEIEKRLIGITDRADVIFYNPFYVDGKVVTASKNVIRVSNLNSNMFKLLQLFIGDIEVFEKFIKKQYGY